MSEMDPLELQALLDELASGDDARIVAADDRIQELDPITDWYQARQASWFVAEPQAIAILTAASSRHFPVPAHDWRDGLNHLLFMLVRSPHPSLTPYIVDAYAQVGGKRLASLLCVLGAIESEEAARAWVTCTRDGLPEDLNSRVFGELGKLLAWPEVLLPHLLAHQGRWVSELTLAILSSISAGRLDVASMDPALSQALAPHVLKSLRSLIPKIRRKQKSAGQAWRFTESYARLRYDAGVFIDLAGRIGGPKLAPWLTKAAALEDPRLVTFATLALLRSNHAVPEDAIEKAAASDESRELLFAGLEELELLARFPVRWRTWEDFARASLVQWLCHPSELSREPDEIELVSAALVDPAKPQRVYLFRFRGPKGQWLAGLSGPHLETGEPRLTGGSHTFSAFETFDGKSAQEHMDQIIGIVSAIA
jgi:hypothetical protein